MTRPINRPKLLARALWIAEKIEETAGDAYSPKLNQELVRILKRLLKDEQHVAEVFALMSACMIDHIDSGLAEKFRKYAKRATR